MGKSTSIFTACVSQAIGAIHRAACNLILFFRFWQIDKNNISALIL